MTSDGQTAYGIFLLLPKIDLSQDALLSLLSRDFSETCHDKDSIGGPELELDAMPMS